MYLGPLVPTTLFKYFLNQFNHTKSNIKSIWILWCKLALYIKIIKKQKYLLEIGDAVVLRPGRSAVEFYHLVSHLVPTYYSPVLALSHLTRCLAVRLLNLFFENGPNTEENYYYLLLHHFQKIKIKYKQTTVIYLLSANVWEIELTTIYMTKGMLMFIRKTLKEEITLKNIKLRIKQHKLQFRLNK